MVGAPRFELGTPSPPDWCANRAALRSAAIPRNVYADEYGHARSDLLGRRRGYFDLWARFAAPHKAHWRPRNRTGGHRPSVFRSLCLPDAQIRSRRSRAGGRNRGQHCGASLSSRAPPPGAEWGEGERPNRIARPSSGPTRGRAKGNSAANDCYR